MSTKLHILFKLIALNAILILLLGLYEGISLPASIIAVWLGAPLAAAAEMIVIARRQLG